MRSLSDIMEHTDIVFSVRRFRPDTNLPGQSAYQVVASIGPNGAVVYDNLPDRHRANVECGQAERYFRSNPPFAAIVLRRIKANCEASAS